MLARERRRVRARRVCNRMADDSLLEAVRGLHLAHPELGPKPLLAKLRRSAAELKEAVTHYERAAALSSAPAVKADMEEAAGMLRACAAGQAACSSVP